MTRRLIVSDMDKTLLNADHALAPLTLQTLRELHALGHVITLASGRHHQDLASYRQQLGFPTYVISSNGAHLYQPDDQLISETLIEPELVKAASALPLDEAIGMSIYTRDGWLINRPDPELAELHQHTAFRYEVTPGIYGYDGDDAAKLLYAGTPEQLAVQEGRLRENFEGKLHITYSQPHYLEVMAPGVNKGTALSRLLEELSLTTADCHVFGDNLNDLEMLQLADHAHVMANAHPQLAGQIPHAKIIGHHDEEGVARQLRASFNLD
ncbi:HAD family hydrolase [Pokkaliibacter sp. CJK22405]|uniref:HAD family hydrolase n=1 Tax=Pokkaliibacter sp. CJK22405 TaxID=3384615 RepID=UPI003985001D